MNKKKDAVQFKKGYLISFGLMISFGIVAIWRTEATPPLASGDADIGTGLMRLFGVVLTVLGTGLLISHILYLGLRRYNLSARRAGAITFAAVALLATAVWFVSIGKHQLAQNRYRQEIVQRYDRFVGYKGIPNVRSSNNPTSSVHTRPAAVVLDLHDCSPGIDHVTNGGSTYYFLFSGVKSDSNLGGNLSDCVFYIGKRVSGQPFDGSLPAECTWYIADDRYYNDQILTPIATGYDFGKLLGFCKDLQTGSVPNI